MKTITYLTEDGRTVTGNVTELLDDGTFYVETEISPGIFDCACVKYNAKENLYIEIDEDDT